MANIKETNIKNRTYYFFDDIINIKNFIANLLKIEKKSYKNIDIYYTGYVTIKNSRYVNNHSVNPLYFIVDTVDRFIEEKEGNKYLNFAFTNNNKDVLEKYGRVRWNGNGNEILEWD